MALLACLIISLSVPAIIMAAVALARASHAESSMSTAALNIVESLATGNGPDGEPLPADIVEQMRDFLSSSLLETAKKKNNDDNDDDDSEQTSRSEDSTIDIDPSDRLQRCPAAFKPVLPIEQLRQSVHEDNMPSDLYLTHGAVYQILIANFFDGDGNGVGDIRGVIDRLQYIKDTGFETIYLMGPWRGTSYFNFDVVDHFNVNPRWGTNRDFDRFVAEAHALGLRVMVDLQVHSTSFEHPLFQQALDCDAEAMERYNITQNFDSSLNAIFGGSLFRQVQWDFPESCLGQKHVSDGEPDRPYFYKSFFNSRFFVHLNNEHPENQRRAEQIMATWIERCVDGFRVDIPQLSRHGEGSLTHSKQAVHFNDWLVQAGRLLKPDLFFYAESLAANEIEESAKVFGGADDSFFRSYFQGDVRIFAEFDPQTGVSTAVSSWRREVADVAARGSSSVLLPSLENHDTPRALTNFQIRAEEVPSFLVFQDDPLAPSSYAPSSPGTFRIHLSAASGEASTTALYYFVQYPLDTNDPINTLTFEAPNPFFNTSSGISGAITVDETAAGGSNPATCTMVNPTLNFCPSFIQAGTDDFGLWWEINAVVLQAIFVGNSFGFLFKEKNTDIKEFPFDLFLDSNLILQAVNAGILQGNSTDYFVQFPNAAALGRPGSEATAFQKASMALLMTWPGTPLVFAGGEWGSQGLDGDSTRESLLWGIPCSSRPRGRNCQVESFTPREKNAPDSVTQATVPNRYNEPSQVTPLSEQLGDPESFYEFSKLAIRERRDNPVLRRGSLHQVVIDTPGTDAIRLLNGANELPVPFFSYIAYRRTLYKDSVYTIVNLDPDQVLLFEFDPLIASNQFIYEQPETELKQFEGFSACQMQVHYSTNVVRLDWRIFALLPGGTLVASMTTESDILRNYDKLSVIGTTAIYQCPEDFIPDFVPSAKASPALATYRQVNNNRLGTLSVEQQQNMDNARAAVPFATMVAARNHSSHRFNPAGDADIVFFNQLALAMNE